MPCFFLSIRRRKNIGDGSNFRIDTDDLDFPARNVSEVKVFVEINGSRITGEIFAKLPAGRGEDQLLSICLSEVFQGVHPSSQEVLRGHRKVCPLQAHL